MSDIGSEKKRVGGLPRFGAWMLMISALLVGAVYLYYVYDQSQRTSLSAHRLRSLEEVAQAFNNSLGQLVSMQEYGESDSTIQSVFISYKVEDGAAVPKANESCAGAEAQVNVAGSDSSDRAYVLDADRLTVLNEGVVSTIDIEDILSEPKDGFALFVIADQNNRVVSRHAHAAGLSLIDTRAISRAIQARDREDWVKLAAGKSIEPGDDDAPLPGYSTEIEVDLHTGTSRVYVMPFILQHQVRVRDGCPGGTPLFLLGVEPDRAVSAVKTGKRWYLSLLLVFLVGLVMLWTVTRLEMLSQHEALGTFFYTTTLCASYLSFVLVVALLLAFAQRQAASGLREATARQTLEVLGDNTESDLLQVFKEIAPYRQLYTELIACSREAEAGDNDTVQRTGPGRILSSPPTYLQGAAVLAEVEGNLQVHRDGGQHIADVLCTRFAQKRGSAGEVELPPLSRVSVYHPGISVDVGDRRQRVRDSLQIASVTDLPAGGRLLDVFLIDSDGRQVLPMFFFQEFNNRPPDFDVAQRDYFRRIRDQRTWSVDLPGAESIDPATKSVASAFYVQRLLNLNNGTRGNTLGIPLQGHEPLSDLIGPAAAAPFVIGADIELPSLSMSEWADAKAIQDMVFLVIDRVSGDVLFHMDAERAMVENLYRAGKGTGAIARQVRAGNLGADTVSGFYHGEPGRFISAPLPLKQWALVSFIPDSSGRSLLTNAFLSNAAGMVAGLILLWCALHLLRRKITDQELRQRWCLPGTVTNHGILLFASILISGVYFGHHLGLIIGDYIYAASAYVCSVVGGLMVAGVVIAWGYSNLRRMRDEDPGIIGAPTIATDRYLISVFVLFGALLTYYLGSMGDRPGAAIDRYYQRVYEARLNQEEQEAHSIAMTRYPNTVKVLGRDPLSLVPLSESWRRRLSDSCASGNQARHQRSRIAFTTPRDIGSFNEYTAATTAYEWLGDYLFTAAETTLSADCATPDGRASTVAGFGADSYASLWPLVRFGVFFSLALALLCWAWLQFFRYVLSARLFGAPGLIEHIDYVIQRESSLDAQPRHPGLILSLQKPEQTGRSLRAQLREHLAATATPPVQSEQGTPPASIEALILQACPWLGAATEDPACLPGVRAVFSASPAGIDLIALDDCLSQEDARLQLRHIIAGLARYVSDGAQLEVRVFISPQHLRSMLFWREDSSSRDDSPANSDCAAWAKTLRAFKVVAPEEVANRVDRAFLAFEAEGDIALRSVYVNEGYGDEGYSDAEHATLAQKRRWLRMRHQQYSPREWATINYLLTRVVATYRHRWESCSSHERLALYNLSRRRRINPINAQLLEQLALKGLIKIQNGQVDIASNTLSHFVRHAESAATFVQLLRLGEVGTWQQYRVPITVFILLALGFAAVASGSSLYAIAASLIGLFGTIGSLTTSAQMIRDNTQ